jgi:hypothetical protein
LELPRAIKIALVFVQPRFRIRACLKRPETLAKKKDLRPLREP